jgi:hypothetical protein
MARLIDLKDALVVQFPVTRVKSDPLRYLLKTHCQRRTKGFTPEETVTRTERSFEGKNRNSSLTGHTNGVALFSADSFDEAFPNLARLRTLSIAAVAGSGERGPFFGAKAPNE